eukprot:CAMPEP_0179094120 /NCGR_PEP_ID=MMETSP0796-20121207/43147_1 /TAXON_ID=73915 /ORGANISM="Pyrodinium bahamense, Strain pbaha01" /LENGTH=295 /DNA_ID=CAMNT_0020791783 /DNA_START=25 /DNA_END=912 /DNA_ORIENTATION=-
MIGFSNEEDSSDGSKRDLSVLPSMYHKTRLCYAFLEGKCMKGRDCNFAHAQSELKTPGEARQEAQEKLEKRLRKNEKKKRKSEADAGLRDPFFKTQLCPYWMQGQCANGKLCYFAHSQEEVRTTPEATMMLNQMMGMPMMMGGRPPGHEAMMMNHLAMLGPPMVQHQVPMLSGHPISGASVEKKSKRKDEKEDKAKKRKDKDRDNADKKETGKEKEKSKDKEKKEKKSKEAGEKRPKEEKKDREKEKKAADKDEERRYQEKEQKKDKGKAKKQKKEGRPSDEGGEQKEATGKTQQ